MFILGIETTGPHCSAALIDEKGNIKIEKSLDRLNHLKVLTPLIDKLMKENNVSKEDICAVAASRGPGSFTGIRIGVSTARALGQVWKIPCIAVPTLFAFGYSRKEQLLEKKNMAVCPIFDARRNQIYGACIVSEKTQVKSEGEFTSNLMPAISGDGEANSVKPIKSDVDGSPETALNRDGLKEAVKAGPYMLDEFLRKVESGFLEGKDRSEAVIQFIGDGVAKYKDQIENWANERGINVELSEEAYQYADSVAEVALSMYEKGEKVEFNCFQPEYMRKAEAQRKLEERLLGKKEA